MTMPAPDSRRAWNANHGDLDNLGDIAAAQGLATHLRSVPAGPFFFGGALPAAVRSTIWDLLAEVAKHRPLTQDEIHLRCVVRPRPWLELNIHPTTYYRRKKRALQRARISDRLLEAGQ